MQSNFITCLHWSRVAQQTSLSLEERNIEKKWLRKQSGETPNYILYHIT